VRSSRPKKAAISFQESMRRFSAGLPTVRDDMIRPQMQQHARLTAVSGARWEQYSEGAGGSEAEFP
jgi:hypothetical protein